MSEASFKKQGESGRWGVDDKLKGMKCVGDTVMMTDGEENELSTLPPYEARRFCREIAKMAEKYFENPENKKRFKEWKKEREKNVMDIRNADVDGGVVSC